MCRVAWRRWRWGSVGALCKSWRLAEGNCYCWEKSQL